GTVDSGYTGSIESFANGWYRCSATKTASGTTASGKVRLQLATSDNTESITGDGSSGTFIYGSQFEQGSFPTSYIPTSGTSVTRVKDATQSLVIDDMTGSSEFTWFFNNTGMNVLTSVTIYMQILCSGGALRYYATNGGRFRGSSYFGEINAIGKLAVKSDGTTLTMFMNGVKSTSTLTQSIGTFTSFSGLNISGETFSGGLHNMQFYNTALTDTELEELTTI
ncbi:MAG: hypothetical protein EBY39_14985, partial [Flavobacteriia bacterium]|nr:hypothetical protein [Flavobacteriia bacterium]